MTTVSKQFLDKLDSVHNRATSVFNKMANDLLNQGMPSNNNFNPNAKGINSVQRIKPK